MTFGRVVSGLGLRVVGQTFVGKSLASSGLVGQCAATQLPRSGTSQGGMDRMGSFSSL